MKGRVLIFPIFAMATVHIAAAQRYTNMHTFLSQVTDQRYKDQLYLSPCSLFIFMRIPSHMYQECKLPSILLTEINT